jgi:hypothetical protein
MMKPPAIPTGTLDVSTGDRTCTATIESLGTTAAENCGGTTLTGLPSDGMSLSDPFPIDTIAVAITAAAVTYALAISDETLGTPAASDNCSFSVTRAGVPNTMPSCFTEHAGDLHTARWVCDTFSFPGTVNESARSVAGTMSFDPGAGFVSVGGWIDSPTGAYPAVPALTGRSGNG